MKKFQNKNIVITGATGGLGKELCRSFANRGAKIFALDLDKNLLAKLKNDFQKLNLSIDTYTCDVTNEKDVKKSMDFCIANGGIDVLINNAGITHRSAFLKTDLKVIQKVVSVNLFGSINCTKFALESIINKQGSIVALSSPSGYSPLIARTGYSASKHALHGFFGSLRTELFTENVHVLIACPSFTRTNIGINALDTDGKKTSKPQQTMGKPLEPSFVAEEIAKAVEQRKDLILIGKLAKKAWWVFRLLPKVYQKVMAKRLKAEME